jgi:putative two-component system response regulator
LTSNGDTGEGRPGTPKRHTILIVDDTVDNLHVLTALLKDSYNVKAAKSGEQALKVAFADTPDMVLLDVMMPEMDGYETIRKLKENVRTANVPVIFLTALKSEADESKGFGLGAVDYISKPISPSIVLHRVRTHLSLHDQQMALEDQVRKRTAELEDSRLQIIRRLGRAAEFRDDDTGNHVMRMSLYSKLLAQACGRMTSAEVEMILNAAPMHDVGKIGIPDGILLKPAKLDEDEWALMRKHAEWGADIIGEHSSPLLQMARVVAMTHHEKWNGKGYPKGLAGEEIPLVGRIAAIADVFDALTSVRPYKKAWTVDSAMELIGKEAGHHFDPALAALFLSLRNEIETIAKKYA